MNPYVEEGSSGTLRQKQADYRVLRLRFVAGDVSASALEAAAKVARDFGRAEVHLTTRQGLEIPWIRVEDVPVARQTLAQAGLVFGADGATVRTVVGCPGSAVCSKGWIDTKAIARRFDAVYFGTSVPHKFKFAVTGCANNCAKANENDLGVMGGVRPRWIAELCVGCDLCLEVCPVKTITRSEEGDYQFDSRRCFFCGNCVAGCPQGAWEVEARGSVVWIGGTMGKVPRLGTRLTGLISDNDKLFETLEAAVRFYRHHGRAAERLGRTLDRIGVEPSKAEILVEPKDRQA